MTFWLGLAIGFIIGGSLGTAVMAFFCGISHHEEWPETMSDTEPPRIHILPGGQRVIIARIDGGFIATHWTSYGTLVFGHGASRAEALAEVTEKLRNKVGTQ